MADLLKYVLRQLNKNSAFAHGDYSQTSKSLYTYRKYAIEEAACILSANGYRVKSLHPAKIKGRHINALFRYWMGHNQPLPIIRQKYELLLKWWVLSVGNEGALKPFEAFMGEEKDYRKKAYPTSPIKNHKEYENFNHILLPSDICYDCTTTLEESRITSYSKLVIKCPDCQRYVGKSEKGVVLGHIADQELRESRKQAHIYLDNLWKRKLLKDPTLTNNNARSKVYSWLSSEIGLNYHLCHIGYFDQHLCQKTISICKPHFRRLLS